MIRMMRYGVWLGLTVWSGQCPVSSVQLFGLMGIEPGCWRVFSHLPTAGIVSKRRRAISTHVLLHTAYVSFDSYAISIKLFSSLCFYDFCSSPAGAVTRNRGSLFWDQMWRLMTVTTLGLWQIVRNYDLVTQFAIATGNFGAREAAVSVAARGSSCRRCHAHVGRDGNWKAMAGNSKNFRNRP